MATSGVTLATRTSVAEPCPCGCQPCQDTCCTLDCLERPQFFCGQLLTDHDLNHLLEWTQDKLRLTRYRHGWGVVCGLHVRCDPKNPAGVIVGPGYAVSDCGDDIIVCQDTLHDLSRVCTQDQAPCADLRRATVDPSDAPRTVRSLGFYEVPLAEIRAVDLFIRYKEAPASPQTAFGRTVCGETAACEYSRVQETHKLVPKLVSPTSDPLLEAAHQWHQQYTNIWGVLEQMLPAGDRWSRLATHIMNEPLHQFCFINELIRERTADQHHEAEDSGFIQALFFVAQDRHNAYLSLRCHSCQNTPGVPLARVWLRTTNDQGRQQSTIVAIDPLPPYRRPISPVTLPTPTGQINLAPLIWQRREEAERLLVEWGISAEYQSVNLPAHEAEIKQVFTCPDQRYPLFVSPRSSVTLHLVRTEWFGERVAGVCPRLAREA